LSKDEMAPYTFGTESLGVLLIVEVRNPPAHSPASHKVLPPFFPRRKEGRRKGGECSVQIARIRLATLARPRDLFFVQIGPEVAILPINPRDFSTLKSIT
jgi:hypothetical protein